MKLLTRQTDYSETIELANNLTGTYDKPVIFHCYWNGNQLNDKHLYSIMSCFYFNVLNKKHKIILWLENNIPNNINKEISKYCEIKHLSLNDEKIKSSFLKNYNYKFNGITFYSDFIRLLLLYNYGGCWFDLDCFFLRSFEPLFVNYEEEISFHGWEKRNYPGNGIIISLEKKSTKLKNIMEFIKNRNRGWGCQEAMLTYDLPLDIFILPCSWISPDWIRHSNYMNPLYFFKKSNKKYNFESFHKGAFCYHWHNKWNMSIEDNSIILQLVKIIKNKI